MRQLIMWLVRRTRPYNTYYITEWADKAPKRVAKRRGPFLEDEIQTNTDWIYKQLPWWIPCNAFLHQWLAGDDEDRMHDHPRWSITICLKGKLTEKTPEGNRILTPGSIVFRSSKSIHGFKIEPEDGCRTWTLFIVGRRRRVQNKYIVTRCTDRPIRGKKPNDKN